MPSPIIDFHIHMLGQDPPIYSMIGILAYPVSTHEEYDKLNTDFSTPESMVNMLREEGADYGVILADYAPLVGGEETSNEVVGEFCSGHPELVPFCSANPYLHGDTGKFITEACKKYPFKGVKLLPTYNHYYPEDRRMYPLYAAAQEIGIPVMFHTGSSVLPNTRIKYGNPIFMDALALDFPELKIILSHGGRGPWYKEAMYMIQRHEHVYIDATGLPVRKLPEYFPGLEHYAGKFVFGTDWPQVRVKHAVPKYGQLGLSDEALAKILGGNAAKLLGLPEKKEEQEICDEARK